MELEVGRGKAERRMPVGPGCDPGHSGGGRGEEVGGGRDGGMLGCTAHGIERVLRKT